MSEPDEYSQAFGTLYRNGVRFVVIGVGGANFYARVHQTLFFTQDRDVFLPAAPENLLRCWETLTAAGWKLWAGAEPLDLPMVDLSGETQRQVVIAPGTPADLS
ncbi:MAG: hypothetical protein HC897_08570, partial [Thermoanaerobaculia bacterium]|nr:hypothetical protein [Thermoanaerobaculia bacterium]